LRIEQNKPNTTSPANRGQHTRSCSLSADVKHAPAWYYRTATPCASVRNGWRWKSTPDDLVAAKSRALGPVNRDGSDTFPGRTLTPDQAEELAAWLALFAAIARARTALLDPHRALLLGHRTKGSGRKGK